MLTQNLRFIHKTEKIPIISLYQMKRRPACDFQFAHCTYNTFLQISCIHIFTFSSWSIEVIILHSCRTMSNYWNHLYCSTIYRIRNCDLTHHDNKNVTKCCTESFVKSLSFTLKGKKLDSKHVWKGHKWGGNIPVTRFDVCCICVFSEVKVCWCIIATKIRQDKRA